MKKPPDKDPLLNNLEQRLDALQQFAFGGVEVAETALPAMAALGQAAAMRRLFLARLAGDHDAANQHLDEMREWRLAKGYKNPVKE